MSLESPATLLANPSNKNQRCTVRKRYVPISGITHIHNTVYHLPSYRGCLHLICRFALCLTQNKVTSAFIITKLSRLRDGTQEQLLAMHLRGDTSTRRGRNRTCGSNRYVRVSACTQTQTHADKTRAPEHTGLDTLSSHPQLIGRWRESL